MLWGAFIFGLLGSMHCAGMCGPIALALPGKAADRFGFFTGRILYNLGRIVTYTLLGGFVSLLGVAASLFHAQQSLSILIGIFILLWGLVALGWIKIPGNWQWANFQSTFVKTKLGHWLSKDNPESLFIIGILNGMLPCGLVMLGLMNAALATTTTGGMLSMTMFGLGTFPMMFAIAYSPRFLSVNIRSKINKLLPIMLILIGGLFIVRGMSLGIPYLSPAMEMSVDGDVTVSCCDHE